MKKDPKIFLQHIKESIEQLVAYTSNLSQKEFYSSTLIQDAVARRLEIIGEATKNLPESFKRRHPEIPWKKISGLRDVLIHEYFGVDLKLLWNIIEKDLKTLKKQIETLL